MKMLIIYESKNLFCFQIDTAV